MKHAGQKTCNQVLGPKALAVISCALALLAAQPLSGSTSKNETVASVKLAGQAEQLDSRIKLAPRQQSSAPRHGSQLATAQPRRSHLHILATVEMLQRLLSAELRPMERQIVPAMVFEPVLVCEILLTPACRPCIWETPEPPRLAYEQQFAITQCLLAPPVA